MSARRVPGLLVLLSAGAYAVPGPDSVVVVSNASVAESVLLGDAYADAREVPHTQRCALELPDTVDIDLATFRDRLLEPLRACLGDAEPRIEAAVLVRGVPLRVAIPTDEGADRVSLAAALGLWRSEHRRNGGPLLGEPPGRLGQCGANRCLSATWRNPWSEGPFHAGWRSDTRVIRWRPILVTMLHGRSYADARRLVDSALDSEGRRGGDGRILLMRGRDGARGVLDTQYPAVAGALEALGQDVEIVDFDPDRTGERLAAFTVGTASIGDTIEANDFVPGAIVDNLTSFGAVPANFEAEGESQVSIARWVARGVAGVHGTTDEPLNNCFPSRELLVDYAAGATLAEAFHRHLPFVYWRNLVLGDPMAAPYAVRPDVRIDVADDPIRVTVEDELDRRVSRLTLYADGSPVADTPGRRLDVCLTVDPGASVRLLAVAQAEDTHPAKGWTAVTVEGPRECAPDGGTPDAAPVDAAPPDGAPDAAAIDVGTDAPPEAPTLDAGPVAMADAEPTSDDPGEGSGGSTGCRSVPGWLAVLLLPLVPGRRRRE